MNYMTTKLVDTYIQYSKRITTVIVAAFFVVVVGAICLIAFADLMAYQVDAIVAVVGSSGTFSAFGITTYHLNSVSEKFAKMKTDIANMEETMNSNAAG